MTKQTKKPRMREVVQEMGRDIGRFGKSAYSRVASAAEDIPNLAKWAWLGFEFGTMPHYIPTFRRLCREEEEDSIKIKNSEGCTAFGSLLATGAAEIAGYYHAFKQFGAKALLIPVATNIASAGYEWYRNARERVLERKLEEGR